MFDIHPGGSEFMSNAKRIRQSSDSTVESHLGKRARVHEPFYSSNTSGSTTDQTYAQPFMNSFSAQHPQVPYYQQPVASPMPWEDTMKKIHSGVGISPHYQQQVHPGTGQGYPFLLAQTKTVGGPQDIQYPHPTNASSIASYPTAVHHHVNNAQQIAARAADDQWGWYVDAD